MATETARGQLGLDVTRGAYIDANNETEIVSGAEALAAGGNARGKADFAANKITDPGGGPGANVRVNELWDGSR